MKKTADFQTLFSLVEIDPVNPSLACASKWKIRLHMPLHQVCVCVRFHVLSMPLVWKHHWIYAVLIFHSPKPLLRYQAWDKPGLTVSTKTTRWIKHVILWEKNRVKSQVFQYQHCSWPIYVLLSPHILFSFPRQACGDPKAKPSYLVDKNLESAVKFIVRKFPAVETRNNNVSIPTCTFVT